MGETTLMMPSSMVTSMPRPPNSPDVSSCTSGIIDRLEIARMRVERGQHALDGSVDQRALVGRIDIFGADTVEDFAEQGEIGIDLVGRARLGRIDGSGRRRGHRLFLRDQRRDAEGGQGKHDDGSSGQA